MPIQELFPTIGEACTFMASCVRKLPREIFVLVRIHPRAQYAVMIRSFYEEFLLEKIRPVHTLIFSGNRATWRALAYPMQKDLFDDTPADPAAPEVS